jgi:hypothetical protein
MVVALGVLGGAFASVVFWLFALLVASALAWLPRFESDELLRPLLGGTLGVGFFLLVSVIARKQAAAKGKPAVSDTDEGPVEGA